MEGEQRPGALPDADTAYVEPSKLTEYLLNPDHPIGRDKAAFLSRFGFRRDAWRVLESALLIHARAGRVVAERQSTYGRHYTVEGRLPTPDARNPIVRTAWVVAWGGRRPRFVTAHPGRRSGGR